MTRPTRTRKTRIEIQHNDDSDDSNSSEEEQSDEPKRPVKRVKRISGAGEPGPETSSAKTSSVKRRGNAGKLAGFMGANLDVQYKIFETLHPLDLLRVSRASKALRRTLLSRTSRSIWNVSLANIPFLPACPDDMTQPAFAQLMFEPTCHGCGRMNIKTVLWALRYRACSRCFRDNSDDLIKLREVTSGLRVFGVPADTIRQLLPAAHGSGKSKSTTYILRQDYVELVVKLTSCTMEERDAVLASRRERTHDLQAFVNECAMFTMKTARQQRQEKMEAYNQRREQVEDRLRELGYAEELEWMSAPERYGVRALRQKFSHLEGVWQPRPLTDQIWSQIKIGMVNFMDRTRSYRQVDAQLELLTQRGEILATVIRSRTPNHIHQPRVYDLCSVDAIQQVFMRPPGPAELDDVVAGDFEQAFPFSENSIGELLIKRKSQLLAKLPLPESGVIEESDLDRATTLFACRSGCGRHDYEALLTAKQAATHHCRPGMFSRDLLSDHWQVRDWIEQLRVSCSWLSSCAGSTNMDIASSAVVLVQALITDIGMDIQNTTFADMDSRDAWFTCDCYECSRNPLTRNVFDWRHAIQHTVNGYRKPSLKRVDDPLVEIRARERRAELEAQLSLPSEVIQPRQRFIQAWSCVHCDKSPLDAMVLRQHLLQAHGIDLPVIETDFVTSPDCFASLIGRVVLNAWE